MFFFKGYQCGYAFLNSCCYDGRLVLLSFKLAVAPYLNRIVTVCWIYCRLLVYNLSCTQTQWRQD